MGTINNHLSIINNHFAFAALHLSRGLYKSHLFMQNKPNFLDAQMNITSFHTMDYENKSNWTLGENKPNSKPIKPNLLNAQMNVNKVLTRDYENKPFLRPPAKQTQSNPISNPKKCPGTVISHFFKQFEKKLVTARQSRDYLENREKDERNKSFISGEIWPE